MKPEDSRSMCPMTSDTKVIVKSNENDVRIANIRDIYDDYIQYGTLYDVWTQMVGRKASLIAQRRQRF